MSHQELGVQLPLHEGQGGMGGGEGRGGWGQVVQGLLGLGEDLGFYPGEWEPWSAVGRRRAAPGTPGTSADPHILAVYVPSSL